MAHESSRQARDRGVTRSKAEKARPPTAPVPQVDIVPGRLTEAEWMALTVLEEGEEVVGDILADLLARVMDSAFKVYLTQQCIPFTISQAREAMLQMIEWRFLARDEGESAVAQDPTWGEDEEPLACTTDAWAQGSVPVLHAPASVELEKPFQSEDQGSVDQISLERSWMDRGLEEQLESWECSSELKDNPGSPPKPDLFQESSVETVEMVPTGSPHPSLELSRVASALESAERPQPLSSQFLIEDRYYCTPQQHAAGDQRAFKMTEVPCTASYPAMLSPSPSFQPQQPWGGDSKLSVLPYRVGHKAAFRQPPHRWVCPLVETVDPDLEVHPLEVYHMLQRVKKMEAPEAPTRYPATRPRCLVSPAAFCPLPPVGSFPAAGPGLQIPPSSLGLSSPGFQSKEPLPRHVIHFPESQQELLDIAHSPSTKTWPSKKGSRSWDREAESLEEQWAARSGLPTSGLDPWDQKGQDAHSLPFPEPQILKATSEVMWKPMLQPEVLKLVPGVSMWNPNTQTLISSGTPQQEDKEVCTSLPIQ